MYFNIDSQFMLRKKKTPVGVHSPFSVTKKQRRRLK